jgi:hypothetical protein
VELHGQLIDRLEHVIRRHHQRAPFGALNVHLHDEPFTDIAVGFNVAGNRLERPAVDGGSLRAHAFGVKDRRAAGAGRHGGIEAVVLVDGNPGVRGHIAAPRVFAVDAVRVA